MEGELKVQGRSCDHLYNTGCITMFDSVWKTVCSECDWVVVVRIIEMAVLWIKQYIVYVQWVFGTSNTGHITVGDRLNKVTVDWGPTVVDITVYVTGMNCTYPLAPFLSVKRDWQNNIFLYSLMDCKKTTCSAASNLAIHFFTTNHINKHK